MAAWQRAKTDLLYAADCLIAFQLGTLENGMPSLRMRVGAMLRAEEGDALRCVKKFITNG